MTTIRCTGSPPFGVDMDNLYDELVNNTLSMATPTGFDVSEFVVTGRGYGTGFTYERVGGDLILNGGHLSGLDIPSFLDGSIKMRGIDVDGATFGRFVANGNIVGARHLVMQGNDVITATIYGDLFYSDAGNDRISALGGDDTLFAGTGDDTIIGGVGNDMLTGNAGKDVFVFDTALSATTNVDVIDDFKFVDDVIKLDNAIFTAFKMLGTMVESRFHIGVAAQDAGDRIIYDRAEGVLSYDRDGSGGADAVVFAHVDPGTLLGFRDIVII
jgi:Ca2+-binding RTX toxin-like protein